MRPRAAISWSGGKDSCAAFHRARIVTVRSSKLDESYLGRELDEDLRLMPRAFSRPLRLRACGRATHGGCIAEDLVLDE